jgi:hypothetical protein
VTAWDVLGRQLRLANEFTYNGSERERILAICAPLYFSTTLFNVGQRAGYNRNEWTIESTCIMHFEEDAREALHQYVTHRPRSPRSEKTRFTDIAETAEHLESLLEDGESWLVPDGTREILLKQLAVTAQEARNAIGHVDSEFDADPFKNVHDPIRLQFGFEVLWQQNLETHELPVKSRTSAAARLLLAAVNPVMVYAQNVLGINRARSLTQDNAEYMIGQCLSGKFDQPAED